MGRSQTVSEAAKELRRLLRKERDSCALHPEFETCDKLKMRLIKKEPR
jgi:hypothetical protein